MPPPPSSVLPPPSPVLCKVRVYLRRKHPSPKRCHKAPLDSKLCRPWAHQGPCAQRSAGRERAIIPAGTDPGHQEEAGLLRHKMVGRSTHGPQ